MDTTLADLRIPPLPPGQWGPAHVAALGPRIPLADRVGGRPVSVGELPALFPVWMRSLLANPEVVDGWRTLAHHLARHGVIEPRLREILILRVAWLGDCAMEWAEHAELAERAGATVEEIQAVSAGPANPVWDPATCAAIQAADELFAGQRVTGDTWDRLAAHLSPAELVELLFLVGNYVMLLGVLNSIFREPPRIIGRAAADGAGQAMSPPSMRKSLPVE